MTKLATRQHSGHTTHGAKGGKLRQFRPEACTKFYAIHASKGQPTDTAQQSARQDVSAIGYGACCPGKCTQSKGLPTKGQARWTEYPANDGDNQADVLPQTEVPTRVYGIQRVVVHIAVTVVALRTGDRLINRTAQSLLVLVL